MFEILCDGVMILLSGDISDRVSILMHDLGARISKLSVD